MVRLPVDQLTQSVQASSLDYCNLAMVTKPPKAPCWRDFVSQQPGGRGHSEQTDQSQAAHQFSLFGVGPSDMAHAQSLKSSTNQQRSSARQRKKSRSKLHRTRSEVSIGNRDIPDVNGTVTLAETKPCEYGLRPPQFDTHIYIEDSMQRCERWLEQVRAARPLEDVHFAQGSGVELVIPDEDTALNQHGFGHFQLDLDVDTVSVDSYSGQSAHKKSRSRCRYKDKETPNPDPNSTTVCHLEASTDY